MLQEEIFFEKALRKCCYADPECDISFPMPGQADADAVQGRRLAWLPEAKISFLQCMAADSPGGNQKKHCKQLVRDEFGRRLDAQDDTAIRPIDPGCVIQIVNTTLEKETIEIASEDLYESNVTIGELTDALEGSARRRLSGGDSATVATVIQVHTSRHPSQRLGGA